MIILLIFILSFILIFLLPLLPAFHLFLCVSLLTPSPSASLFFHADLHEPSYHRRITDNPRFNQPSPLTHTPPSTHAPSHFIFLSSSIPHWPNSPTQCRRPTLTHLTLATDLSLKPQVPSLPMLTHLGLSSLFLEFVLVFRHGFRARFLLVVVDLWVSASQFVFFI